MTDIARPLLVQLTEAFARLVSTHRFPTTHNVFTDALQLPVNVARMGELDKKHASIHQIRLGLVGLGRTHLVVVVNSLRSSLTEVMKPVRNDLTLDYACPHTDMKLATQSADGQRAQDLLDSIRILLNTITVCLSAAIDVDVCFDLNEDVSITLHNYAG